MVTININTKANEQEIEKFIKFKIERYYRKCTMAFGIIDYVITIAENYVTCIYTSFLDKTKKFELRFLINKRG